MAVAAVTPQGADYRHMRRCFGQPDRRRRLHPRKRSTKPEGRVFPWASHTQRFLGAIERSEGNYSGKVLLSDEQSGRTLRYLKFIAPFEQHHEMRPVHVDAGELEFPKPGTYFFEVYFATRDGEALKGEFAFAVLGSEE